MTFREVEKIVCKDGWRLKNIKGSHHHYKHPTKPGKVTIPKHPGDIDKKTVSSIFEQAGLS